MGLRRGQAVLVLSPLLLTFACQGPATPTTGATEGQAVKAVEGAGGNVVRDDNDPAKPVVEVSLSCPKVADQALSGLAGLKRLKTPRVASAKVTDAGLKELADLKGLQTLHLAGTLVTNAGVAEFRRALPACKIVR